MKDDGDPRLWRLLDMDGKSIGIRCVCGRSTEYMQGALQRRHHIPSTTLVSDLQYRLRCQHCNRTSGFEISVAEEKERGRPGEHRIVVVPGRPY